MKKSFLLFRGSALYKRGILPALMAFLFVAGMHLDMNAQQKLDGSNMPNMANNSKSLFMVPTGNFVSVDVAKARLTEAMQNLKAQASQYTEGTPPYIAAIRRVTYYNTILDNLNGGKGVAQSITDSLTSISSGQTSEHMINQDIVLAEKNAAITLLRP